MKQFLFLVFIILSTSSIAQTQSYENDVKSIDNVIKALYDVISGEPNTTRDWARFRNLFKPETRLIPTSKSPQGEFTYRAITPEEYIQMFTTRITTGFYERELSHTVEEYGTIAHVFSTYETKQTKDGPVTNRGINSIQLFKDKDRYYILNIFWCAENMGFPLPEKYLK